ncbi:MAG TPA: carbohydrate ABC transporter permease [Acetobacteraceae bacterium]|nr:carbohydrate ABC transporter permease [Acetobacteraceae bacterium]
MAEKRTRRRRNYRLRRTLVEGSSILLGAAIVIWSLIPVYNMFLVALDPLGHNEFSGLLWPEHPTLEVFANLWTEGADDVEGIWRQFGNSIYIGAVATALTVLISSMASFAIGRMRLGRQWTITGTALLTYAIPASVLIIPFIRIMQIYGLSDNLWAVIAAEITFATPYAILVLLYYAKLIPAELDDAARIDGASVVQIYFRIYLPLMAPALAAVGTYALLYAWNDYFYQYMLLMSEKHTTVAVALEQFFDDDDAPWNYMMAIAIIYSLPPIATFYALRRFMATGLTAGGMKG